MKLSATLLMGLLLVGTSAFAAPILDGQVLPGDAYTAQIFDATGEGSYGVGLDIASLSYSFDSTYAYFGLSATGTFSARGSDLSIDGATVFDMNMTATDSGPLVRKLRVYMTSPTDAAAGMYTSNSALASPIWLAGAADIAVAETANGGLEVRMPRSQLGNLGTDFYVRGQLDDTGEYADDVIAGRVPEPMTIALLSIGGVVLMARRRK